MNNQINDSGSGENENSLETQKQIEKKARHYLTFLLARRDYSQVEIKRKFYSQGYSSQLCEQLLSEFIDKGYQSDSRFTEVFVRNKISRGYGKNKIFAELQAHKISYAEFELCLAELEVDWFSQLLQLYEKRYGETGPDNVKDKQKISRYLMQKGFNQQEINQLWRELA
ncbi:regulatory protein RecX [Saccharobesus litoralis]|uniref:regulatory protein RecX n=1 Tax=Saccharobesus litoralis TaxID=2172099 RepID=UPI00131F3563|nr:regulatory protein RecX [Saccharobesus litoralis]